MIKRFLILSLAVAAFVTEGASFAMPQTFDTDAHHEPDEPILLMKPAELFSNPKLRQLAVAAQHGDVKKIDALISSGVDVNGKGKYGIAPLFSAWQARNKMGFTALLDHGANPNNVWTTGDTLMNLLATTADPYFLKWALEQGGNVNLVEPHTGSTPLIAAVIFSDGRKNVPILVKSGADLDYQIPRGQNGFIGDGNTALIVAAQLGQFQVVYELLRAGANYRLKNARGWDIRNAITDFNAHNLPPAESHARDCVISFLKKHNFWMQIAPPADFRVSTFSVAPGEFYTLSWTSVPNAKTYDLSLNGKIKLTGITATDIRLKASTAEVNSNGRLDWRVRACDDKGCSPWSTDMAISVVEGPL